MRYNVHKRNTLDRLTGHFQEKMRAALKRHAEANLHEIFEALNAGARSYDPAQSHLVHPIQDLMDEHRKKVVYVAVSDGIQEVSPEHELSLWLLHPIDIPVELTLSKSNAKQRGSIVAQIAEKWAHRHQNRIGELASTLLDDYVASIKKAFRILAGDWLAGESKIGEVKDLLSWSLQRTAYDSERIFRTETTNYFNETRHSYFSDNTDVDYMELYAVTDGRISQICADRHTAVVTIAEAGKREYMPAFHPHCRTIQRPLMSFLSRDKAEIDRGIAYRAQTEGSWTPIVF